MQLYAKALGKCALVLFFVINVVSGQDPSGSVDQGCNHTMLNGQGIVQSPNFPALYNPNSRCQWLITVEQNHTVVLTLRQFALESSPKCKFDNLAVYNGPTVNHPKLGQFCGPFRPSDIRTTSNKMLIQFSSDDSNQKGGFWGFFLSVAPVIATPNSCGGVLNDDTGSFHSVNFPKSNYPNGMTCTWHIRTALDRTISLRFAKLTLEESTDCRYDAVTVIGGWSNSDETTSLGRYCKIADLTDEIISSGNEMFVIFATDSSGNDAGFSAQYETHSRSRSVETTPKAPIIEERSQICPETTVLTDNAGSIISPGYKDVAGYMPNIKCSWKIVARPGSRVVLRFVNLVVEDDPQCVFDYVSVFAGMNEDGELLGRFCGNLADREVRSSGNEMYILFVTDSGGSAPGFQAQYRSDAPIEADDVTPMSFTTPATPISATITATSPSRKTVISSSSQTVRETSASSLSTPEPEAATNCPTTCPELNLEQSVCSSSYVIAAKAVKIVSSQTPGTRLLVSLLKVYTRGHLSASDRKGTKFWINLPCTNCLPALQKRKKYIIAGNSEDAEMTIQANDFFQTLTKKNKRSIRKAVRRCRKRNKRGRRRRSKGKAVRKRKQ